MPLNVAFTILVLAYFGLLFLDWKEQDRRRRELDAKADALLRQADAVAALSGRSRSYSPPPSLPPPEFHIPHSWGIARIIGAWLLIAAHPIVYGLLAAIVASLLWPAAERPGPFLGIFFGGSLVLSIPGDALARRLGAHHWRFHRLLRQQLAAELLRRRPS